jgi:hypothetical protein
MALVKVKKTLQIDSADRDTTKYPTNGDYVVYLPRIYNNVTSLRLKGGEIPLQTSISGFNPLSLSPLMWFDASYAPSLSYNGSNQMTSWRDRSTNNFLATVATPGNSIKYSANGLKTGYPGIVFDGNQGVFGFGSLNLSSYTALSFYIVFNYTSTTVNQRLLSFVVQGGDDYNGAGLDVCIQTAGNLTYITNYGTNNLNIKSATTMTNDSTPYIGSVIANNSTNKTIVNVNLTNNYTNNLTFVSFPFGTNYTFNFAQYGAAPITGVISEVLVFPSVITTAQDIQIQSYLANKWGMTGSLTGYVGTINGVNSHSLLYGENNPAINTTNDTLVSSNTYYLLMELKGLNKTDETRVGGDKSAFVDKYFAKIPTTCNSTGIVSYNDKNLQENIAYYTPAIESLDRLQIKMRTHAQQDGSGFVYFQNNYNLTFEIEYMDNQPDAKTEEN